jgi:DNA replication protein DnaC
MGHRLSKCRLRRRLIDRLTHHAEIISIDGESYRKREAEQAQKRKQESKPKR